MTLRELSPDFDEWPERWMGVKEDLEYGKKLLPYDEYKTVPLKKLVASVETGGMLPDDYDGMTERDLKSFERTCVLFEEFLKKRTKKK